MKSVNEMVLEAVQYIRTITNASPDIAIVLGSGLGDFAYKIVDPIEIPYAEIPYFKSSTVEGHEGKLIFGKIYGREVVAMKGRLHYYEGYSMQEITFPIRVFTLLGVSKLIVTNAAGAINKKFKAGDIMLIKDHLNMSGVSPLMGANCEVFGPRFPSMSQVYSMDMMNCFKQTVEKIARTKEGEAIKFKNRIQEGVYAFMPGPQYETKAEARMLEILGADAVGMSTVPEVIAAAHSGIEVLGLSCITNMADGADVSHEEVLDAVNQVTESLTAFIVETIPNL